MAIFNSYVKLPEGKLGCLTTSRVNGGYCVLIAENGNDLLEIS